MGLQFAAAYGVVRSKVLKYFYQPLPFEPVAICRIIVGLSLFGFAAHVWPFASDIFATQGLAFRTPLGFQIGPEQAKILVLLEGLFGLTVLLGWHTRKSLIGALLVHSILLFSNPSSFWGWGYVVRHVLFFLILVDAGGMWSLDVQFKRRSEKPWTPAWSYRLFQWQASAIYLIVVVHRLDSSDWLFGNALTLALKDGLFSRLSFWPWLELGPWLKPFSYLGLILEGLGGFLFVLGLWLPLRWLIASGLIGLHLILEITTVVQYWQLIMIACLLFYLPELWLLGRKRPAIFIKRSRRAFLMPLAFVSGLALVLINAWPQALLSNPLATVQATLAYPMAQLTIDGTRFTNVFPSTRRIGQTCLRVFGVASGRHIHELYDSRPYCESARFRFFDDPMFSTLHRLHGRGRFDPIGRYFCGRHPDLEYVSYFNLLSNIIPSGGKFIELPGQVHFFYYNCKTGVASRDLPRDLAALLYARLREKKF